MKKKNPLDVLLITLILVLYTGGWLIDCCCHACHDPNRWIAALALVVIFTTFILLAFLSPILRDTVANPKALGDLQPPFSLSRTQLGVWITTIASFYIYAILWDHKTAGELNTTALTLMGISAATFAAAAVVDTSEIQQGIPRSQDEPSSGSFLQDILSDENGVSIHRFQNVIWTVVAIIIYFYNYNNEKPTDFLPNLSSTLLALTGISSATYLVLKTRENIQAPGSPGTFKIVLSAASETDASIQTLLKFGVTTAIVQFKPVSATDSINAKSTGSNNYEIPDLPYGNYNVLVTGSQNDGSGKLVNYSGQISLNYDAGTTMPFSVPIKSA